MITYLLTISFFVPLVLCILLLTTALIMPCVKTIQEQYEAAVWQDNEV